MKRNKPKKTPRGRTTKTVIKKLRGNTVLLPGGGRYRVGEQVRFSGQGITPIKRKGKVGKVGYSIDDVPDLMDYKPEVGVGYGVGFEVGYGVGADNNWKTYTYDRHAVEPAAPAPSAWASWWALLCQYGRELREAFACVLSSPETSAPAPAPTVPPLDSFKPAPDMPPAEIDAGTLAARGPRPKRKRAPRRRKD